jgi:P-type Ca2+ transporter type 2C
MATHAQGDVPANRGLREAEVAGRRATTGYNELQRRQAEPVWRVVLEQFSSPLVLLLIGAAVLAGLIGDVTDSVAITIIVGINAVVGFTQEWRAEKAVLALRELTAARAKVVRDERVQLIPAKNVVVGDLLVLESGDVVAADARLVEAHELSTLEAVLTGESTAVRKATDAVADGTPLAERSDMVFMGTAVATGAGRAIVESVGMSTQMGHIAKLLAKGRRSTTPLQRRLAGLGRILLYACLVLVTVVAGLGLMRGLALVEVTMMAVALAVAAVPEGLPAVVTVALAVGVRRMSRENVLVRRLASVETLGCATVICTDKTGTLTTGVMTVRETWGADEDALLFAAAACCDAELGAKETESIGDPTEIAILRAAKARGVERNDIEQERPRVRTWPFETERRRMAILREDDTLYLKGAMEVVLPLCVEGTSGAREAEEAMAQRGLRVLAVATGQGGDERDLVLRGLLGIADAPRAEAVHAVRDAHRAGIDVVMITGDHPLTAMAIAREMGIVREGVDPEKVVHARKTAADKTEIVRRLRARGEVVAMTGDGVNDAPSIREADIGIAMGQTATEVTRESSEMILTTDDLSGVVAAVREGRIIYENIRKTVVYLLSGNSSQLIFMLIGVAMGLPLPLLPLQLLWVNMMTEPLPGLALAVDPAQDDVLARPPRDPSEPLLGPAQWRQILSISLLHAVIFLLVFAWGLDRYDEMTARSLAFGSFVFGVLLRAFAARSTEKIFWEVGVLGNLQLLGAVALTYALHVSLHLFETTRTLFGLASIELEWFSIAMALGFIPVSVVEITKLVRRRMRRKHGQGDG